MTGLAMTLLMLARLVAPNPLFTSTTTGNRTDACEACQAWVLMNMLRIETIVPVQMMDDGDFFQRNRAQPPGSFLGCIPELVPALALATGTEEDFLGLWCKGLKEMAHSRSVEPHFVELVKELAPGMRSHRTVAHSTFASVASRACGKLLGICRGGESAMWVAMSVMQTCNVFRLLASHVSFYIGGDGFCEDRFGWEQSRWQKANPVLPITHPLLHGTVSKQDHDAMFKVEVEFTRDVEQDRLLPLATTFKVAYLVQGATVQEMSAVWAYLPESASLLVLTFRQQFTGAIYFPGSAMNEGRNMLYFATRLAEREQGWRYDYIVTLEPEVKFLRGGFAHFHHFLSEWRPAVAVPGYFPAYASEGHPDYHGFNDADGMLQNEYAIGRIDFHFVAYHWATLAELWPMDTRQDVGGCWWGAHWLQQQFMSLKYRGFVLASRAVVVHNEIHASYPKVNCEISLSIIDTWLATLLLPEHRHCLMANNAVRGKSWGKPTLGPPRLEAGHYSPWEVHLLDPDSCAFAAERAPGSDEIPYRCSEATSACAPYPLRPSEMLQRPLYVYSPPGQPACFEGMEETAIRLDQRNLALTNMGDRPGVDRSPGASVWRGCCAAMQDGNKQVMFGIFPCWSGQFDFSQCCYRRMAPVSVERNLLPLGDQALNPDRFGANWAMFGGACFRKSHDLPNAPGLGWYFCDAAAGMRGRELTFESDSHELTLRGY